ncbi:amino acid ABC transporter permease [Candidatus Bathyarchaeota archaeon]|nr:amino acid ABC transporter permease [Candidatus Bathyarchaeota archaeon]
MLQAPDLPSIFFYIIIHGLPITLILTAHGLIWGFLIGLLLALMRVYGTREIEWVAIAYEKVFRGIPLLVLIFLFAFGVPGLFWFIDPLYRTLAAVILSLALRSGAYQSQILRGAILSVNPGQQLAARALGMSRLQAFRYVVMPQALRMALPSWSNEYAVVIKDTTFASAVGIIEMLRVTFRVVANNPEMLFPPLVILAIIYLIFTYPITRFFGERQTQKLKDLGLGG